MTNEQIPEGVVGPVESVDSDTALVTDHPPPRCAVATTAFILALLLIPPWVPIIMLRFVGRDMAGKGAVVGMVAGGVAVVLGVIGILRTAGWRRRGRGLAIAAIPIGLVAALLQGFTGLTLHVYVVSYDHSMAALGVLKTPRDEMEAATQKWFDEVASERFQVATTPAEFESWLARTVERWGQLQSVKRAAKAFIQTEGSARRYRFVTQFVNGAADVDIVVGLEDGDPKVDNIRVDGSSPLGLGF